MERERRMKLLSRRTLRRQMSRHDILAPHPGTGCGVALPLTRHSELHGVGGFMPREWDEITASRRPFFKHEMRLLRIFHIYIGSHGRSTITIHSSDIFFHFWHFFFFFDMLFFQQGREVHYTVWDEETGRSKNKKDRRRQDCHTLPYSSASPLLQKSL